MGPLIRVARSVDWEVTRRCGGHCAHCISRVHHPRLRPDLDEAGARGVVARLVEADIHGVHFLGGEPLARPDLPALLRACDDGGIATSLTTSGAGLTGPFAFLLSRLQLCRGVSISFEDTREREQDAIRGRGAFQRALAALDPQRCWAPSVPVTVAWTLTRPALESVHPRDMARYFAERGADRIVIQDLAVPADAPERLRQLDYDAGPWSRFLGRLFDPGFSAPIPVVYPLKPLVVDHLNRTQGTDLPILRYGCNAMSCRVRVLPDGRVLPCSAVIGWETALRDYLDCSPSLGECGLDEILALEAFQRFARTKRRRGDPVLEPCGECPFAYTRCNPCVVARLTGERRSARGCAWVMRERSHPGRWKVPPRVAAAAQEVP